MLCTAPGSINVSTERKRCNTLGGGSGVFSPAASVVLGCLPSIHTFLQVCTGKKEYKYGTTSTTTSSTTNSWQNSVTVSGARGLSCVGGSGLSGIDSTQLMIKALADPSTGSGLSPGSPSWSDPPAPHRLVHPPENKETKPLLLGGDLFHLSGRRARLHS